MSHVSFDERVSRISDRHRRMSVGVTYRIGPDGLMVPSARRRILPRFPVKPFVMLLVLAFGFKALLFVGLGEGLYESRREILAKGNWAEHAAAWIMQPDPIVEAAADLYAMAHLL